MTNIFANAFAQMGGGTQIEQPVMADNNLALSLENESLKLDLALAELDAGLAKLNDLDNLIQLADEFQGKAMGADAVFFFTNRAEEIRLALGCPAPLSASMEDFTGTETDAVLALDQSLSGLKSAAVNGWNAIIDFLKKLYESIAVFVTKLFDTMPGLKKEAEVMKEKADAISGTAENSKHKISGLSALAGRNKDVTLNHFTDNMAKLFTLASISGLVDLAKASNFEKLDNTAEEVAKVKPSDLGITDAAIDKTQDGLDAANSGAPEANAIGRDGDVVKGIYELPGAKAYVVAVAPAHGKDGVAGNEALTAAFKRVNSIKFGIRSEVKDPKFDNSKEVTTLNASQINSVCDVIIDGADKLERSKGGIEEGRKAVQDLLKVAEKLKNNAGKTDYKDLKGAMNAAKTSITRLSNCAGNPYREVAGYFYTTSKAMLGYCGASVKQYK